MKKPALKYCGIRSLQDLQLAADSQADYLGFIFAVSKRKVSPADVKKWLSQVRTEKQIAGVFVNESLGTIARIAGDLQLDVIQLHGDETPKDAEALRLLTNCEIWKALHHNSTAIQDLDRFNDSVDGFVIDSSVKGARGGTGVAFAWDCVPEYQQKAEQTGKRCFIAGGVNPDTIADLLKWRPGGVDLASGIEKNGQKDDKLIRLLEERMNRYVSISE
ncbi:phosphoribosylanthranilate isomerase [Bacillus halotolerans]|uniref:phosphoribosylanthranilate isomerase n=1 Tax=Bacillus halotolerans TaxID=260554 RepID=UPI0007509FFD|nr:phosphoribosylanthranilate isomerase [Bacillus halotolerans]QQF61635.1 phosphoribosylanthranilate isomerase [Bacillus mojavensis]KUP30574.1 N-(5'-phosphoribosyl)anthranilate isomerase [Bacillus halotolerans]KUP42122.1 N-(5'-phosphoribosyl)anthranilate isomerase [Bacillus halotolerans]MBL4969150.1 phosphoribosylanthranilate isomerase [Bacillus halotolerans]MBL4973213.1 phosphoribosylanthranilate isomerase [Bacillus halotolerans]